MTDTRQLGTAGQWSTGRRQPFQAMRRDAMIVAYGSAFFIFVKSPPFPSSFASSSDPPLNE